MDPGGRHLTVVFIHPVWDQLRILKYVLSCSVDVSVIWRNDACWSAGPRSRTHTHTHAFTADSETVLRRTFSPDECVSDLTSHLFDRVGSHHLALTGGRQNDATKLMQSQQKQQYSDPKVKVLKLHCKTTSLQVNPGLKMLLKATKCGIFLSFTPPVSESNSLTRRWHKYGHSWCVLYICMYVI